ncbi:MAG: hypothetical protein JWO11_1565 [Nocardioides sp.]|nr:hypothetical protein [Nocardioides sp.]
MLPEYAGLVDPVVELRAACLAAVAWLGETGPVEVVADAQGRRVAEALLAAAGGLVSTSSTPDVVETPEGKAAPEAPSAYLVVANGSARRGEKAPGHLDERAAGFDERLGRALRGPDLEALAGLDEGLGAELLVGNTTGLRELGGLLTAEHRAMVDYDDDPFGVQYWVMRWQCES